MKTIYIPRQAVVYLIGSSCTGKTTLAKRIRDQSPQPANYLAADEILEAVTGLTYEFLMQNPLMLKKLEQVKGLDDRYQNQLKAALARTLDSPRLMIYDSAPNNYGEVMRFITIAGMIRRGGPIILLKMNPSPELYEQFCAERRQAGRCFPEELLRRGMEITSQEIFSHNFSTMAGNVVEYEITDPRAVKLYFME